MNKIALIENFCTHYTVRLFELLAKYRHFDFYFYSKGSEWYWPKEHGVRGGNFIYQYLEGFTLFGRRIVPSLWSKLWFGNYVIYIQAIGSPFSVLTTYIIARIRRKPFILWTGIWHRLKSRYHRLIFPVVRYIYRHADAVVVYGSHVERYLLSEGVKAQKIFIANHTIDNTSYNFTVTEEEKEALRKRLNIDPGRRVVLYLGRLEDGKGLDYLIEAFASLRREDAILVIAGKGSSEKHLDQLVVAKGIGKSVRFAGYISTGKTVPFYAISWVYVLPSVTTPIFKEPWGLVVNEAFNQGLPVVATAAVGAAAGGLVQDGINGFIVEERDSKAIAQAIERILDDTELRNRMSAQAKGIIDGWTQENIVAGFRQAIEYVTA